VQRDGPVERNTKKSALSKINTGRAALRAVLSVIISDSDDDDDDDDKNVSNNVKM